MKSFSLFLRSLLLIVEKTFENPFVKRYNTT